MVFDTHIEKTISDFTSINQNDNPKNKNMVNIYQNSIELSLAIFYQNNIWCKTRINYYWTPSLSLNLSNKNNHHQHTFNQRSPMTVSYDYV